MTALGGGMGPILTFGLAIPIDGSREDGFPESIFLLVVGSAGQDWDVAPMLAGGNELVVSLGRQYRWPDFSV